MRCHWCELLILGAALTGITHQATAQQRIRELGVQATGTFSNPAVGVLGLYGAIRSPGRTRLSLSLGAGASDGELAFRGELLGHFLLSPEERRRPGFYLAGGVAGVEGAESRGYLVLTAGAEQHPRGRSGWAVELGVGGGARVALAYRWRWFSGVLHQ
jgi:hypothetical protein